MKRRAMMLVLAAAGLSSAPARAEPAAAGATHAVQCFLAATSLLSSEDASTKSSALLATNFFAGQIFGAAPDIDLTAALRREAATLDEARTKVLLTQCGNEMAGRGSQITAAGDALAAEAPPPSSKQ